MTLGLMKHGLLANICIADILFWQASHIESPRGQKKHGGKVKTSWLRQLYLPQTHHVYLDCFQEKQKGREGENMCWLRQLYLSQTHQSFEIACKATTKKEREWKHMLAVAAMLSSTLPFFCCLLLERFDVAKPMWNTLTYNMNAHTTLVTNSTAL